jgi:alkylation response protein AidB-like acyl-CoA dehydrogenase
VEQGVALGRTCVVAAMAGSASEMIEQTIAYTLIRHQFGRPIGSFQAIKHLAVDAYIQARTLRSLTLSLGALEASDDVALDRLSASAKVYASGAGLEVMESCLQMLGGIGYTDEHDLSLYFKNAVSALDSWPRCTDHGRW